MKIPLRPLRPLRFNKNRRGRQERKGLWKTLCVLRALCGSIKTAEGAKSAKNYGKPFAFFARFAVQFKNRKDDEKTFVSPWQPRQPLDD
ncbi:MAG: hypothetical protein N2508_06405 [Anaerolineae bacterium]|nr:hypothetical protein [Anaerolineae bacterium]